MKNKNPLAPHFVHWRVITFGDTDAAAVVYTPRFVDYCMEAIEVWFKECIGIDWYWINVRDSMGTPVVHLELDFISPLIGSDELGTLVRVRDISRSTLTIELEGLKKIDADETTPVFSAKFVFCFVDTKAGKSISIPMEALEKITAYKNDCSFV